MDIWRCRSLLLSKARKFDPQHAIWIVDYITSNIPLQEIRWHLSSDQKVHSLFIYVQQNMWLPQQQWPSWQPPFPQPQPQFPPVHWVQGIQAPFGFPHQPPQLNPNDSFHGNHASFPSFGQMGPLHHAQPHFYPSSNFHGIQAPFHPTGPTGTGCFKLPGDGIQRKHRYSRKWLATHSLATLPELETQIKKLLTLQKSPTKIELLPKLYVEHYRMPLLVDGFKPEDQEQGNDSYSLRSLLMLFNTIKVIESPGGQHVLVKDGHELGVPADDSNLVLAPPSGSNKIFICFCQQKRFDIEDIEDYFSSYGPVNDVQIPRGQRGTFGFVSFVYLETVKLILEESQMTIHTICGQLVSVRAYKEKHELQNPGQEDDHSNSGAPMASDVNAIHEHHTCANAAESSSSQVLNRLDEASEATDGYDFLPKDPFDQLR